MGGLKRHVLQKHKLYFSGCFNGLLGALIGRAKSHLKRKQKKVQKADPVEHWREDLEAVFV